MPPARTHFCAVAARTIGALLDAGEDVLELHHAGVGEHQASDRCAARASSTATTSCPFLAKNCRKFDRISLTPLMNAIALSRMPPDAGSRARPAKAPTGIRRIRRRLDGGRLEELAAVVRRRWNGRSSATTEGRRSRAEAPGPETAFLRTPRATELPRLPCGLDPGSRQEIRAARSGGAKRRSAALARPGRAKA